MGNAGTDEVTQTAPVKMPVSKKANQIHMKEAAISKTSGLLQTNFKEEILSNGLDQIVRTVALRSNFSGDLQELDEKCYSMMEKTTKKQARGFPLYSCKVCGKEETSMNMKSHIEAKHLEGVTIPCNVCEKTFRSRNSLTTHNRRNH